MAAGQGFKTFATGDVLTAPDVNGYLMQGVLVFASAAARDASITSPQQGQVAFLKDSNSTVYYSGSAWVAVGGSSPLTTKGDLYGYSTTNARVPIGTNGQVLTADSTQSLGLKWATAGGSSALTLITPTSIANTGGSASIGANGVVNANGVTSLSLNGVFSSTYTNYLLVQDQATAAGAVGQGLRLRASGADSTGSNYVYSFVSMTYTGTNYPDKSTGNSAYYAFNAPNSSIVCASTCYVQQPFVAAYTDFQCSATTYDGVWNGGGYHTLSNSYDGFTLFGSPHAQYYNISVYGLAK